MELVAAADDDTRKVMMMRMMGMRDVEERDMRARQLI